MATRLPNVNLSPSDADNVVAFPMDGGRRSVGDVFLAAVRELSAAFEGTPAQFGVAVAQLLTAALRPGQRVSAQTIAETCGASLGLAKQVLASGLTDRWIEVKKPAKPGAAAAVALRGATVEREQTWAPSDQVGEQTWAPSDQDSRARRFPTSESKIQKKNQFIARAEEEVEPSAAAKALAREVIGVLGAAPGSSKERLWMGDGARRIDEWFATADRRDILAAASKCAASLRSRKMPTDCTPGYVASTLQQMLDDCERDTPEQRAKTRAAIEEISKAWEAGDGDDAR